MYKNVKVKTSLTSFELSAGNVPISAIVLALKVDASIYYVLTCLNFEMAPICDGLYIRETRAYDKCIGF